MGSYKVPQDVEADDKLLGPFSFRQFIYLMIVAGLVAVAWGLSNIFIGLAIIPVPFIIFFGALALPLRKDQPMETYLAALVNFWTKPRIRLWDAEGIENTIEIRAPKKTELPLTKDIYGTEAIQKLGYLAQVADTGGWSVLNPAAVDETSSKISGDVLAEADATQDMFGNYDNTSQNISRIMDQNLEKTREELMSKVQKEVSASISKSTDQSNDQPSTNSPQQSIVSQTPTSATPTNPAIMKLANDDALSVETISKQANRIIKQEPDEVIISLR